MNRFDLETVVITLTGIVVAAFVAVNELSPVDPTREPTACGLSAAEEYRQVTTYSTTTDYWYLDVSYMSDGYKERSMELLKRELEDMAR